MALDVDNVDYDRGSTVDRSNRLQVQTAWLPTLPARRFEFIPMWGHKVFFVYAPRRVAWPERGIRVERMGWLTGKH